MNCKYCDTPLTDEQAVCPTCGHAVEGRQDREKPPEQKPHIPKSKTQRAIFFGALAVLAILLGAIFWQTFKDGGPKAQRMEREVVVSGEFGLNNTELGYYFWSEYFYFIGSSGENLPASLDTEKPLEDQMYDQNETWYQHILDRTLETVENTMAMAFEAEAAGFALDATYEASLQTVLENFAEYATAQGFVKKDGSPDVQAYLADSFGAGATVESFTKYLRSSYLAAAYADELYLRPQFTADQISAYYDQFAASYAADGYPKDDERLRSLRMVLLAPQAPDDAASWDAARESAENLYAAWQSESGSEDDFAALAQTHSADTATAAGGGLLQQARRQELTGELADWTFDAARKPGDTAIARTDDGWAIAYFVDVCQQTAWQRQAEQELRAETYQNALREILSRHTFRIDRDGIAIATPGGLYKGTTQTAAGTAKSD